MARQQEEGIRRGLYEVLFLDHCEDGPEQRFLVWGRVDRITKTSIRVRVFDYVKKGKAPDENVKYFTILRSAILEVKRLEYCP